MTRGLWLSLGLVGFCLWGTAGIWAQSASSKTKPKPKTATPNAKALDTKLGHVTQQFVRDFEGLAQEYEDAEQYESAVRLWEVLLKLSPEYPGAEAKIKQLGEKMMASTEFDMELDVSGDWVGPVAVTIKDKPFRVQASGDFKVILSPMSSTADGVPVDETGRDLVPGIPLGALMGVLIGPDGKPGRPFRMGSAYEETAKQRGLLLLKINVPKEHRSQGKLKLTLSGVGKISK
jgi:hypothetical protein